jgi:HTH-type transcriptional regulator / antitoxin MqsA
MKGAISMKNEQCPVCGQGMLKKQVGNETFEYKGCSITIPNYVTYSCSECGESIVDNDSLRVSGNVLKNFRREVDGLLSGMEIKRIRLKLGLTQAEMSEVLGGGTKAFARYEIGAICQSKAMDSLLRILDRFPHVLSVIRGSSGSTEEKKVLGLSALVTKQIYSSKKHLIVSPYAERLAYGS